jgi:hypothetical protein
MKYEKTADTQLQYGARFQAVFNDARAVEDVTYFLKNKARGDWRRQGHSLFLYELDDAFYVRLLFGEDLKVLKQTDTYTTPAPKAGN